MQGYGRHFERLAVFLAFRNAFTDEQMNEGATPKSQATSIKRKALLLYPSRRHLIPTTTPKRLRQVLQALLDIDAFATGSKVRAFFSDITDEQIWTRDPKIIHWLPLTDVAAETRPPPISKSKLENETVPHPGSSARASPLPPEILDDTSDIKLITTGPKATAPNGPKIIPRQPRGNGLTEENLSQLNISIGADRVSINRILSGCAGPRKICRNWTLSRVIREFVVSHWDLVKCPSRRWTSIRTSPDGINGAQNKTSTRISCPSRSNFKLRFFRLSSNYLKKYASTLLKSGYQLCSRRRTGTFRRRQNCMNGGGISRIAKSLPMQ